MKWLKAAKEDMLKWHVGDEIWYERISDEDEIGIYHGTITGLYKDRYSVDGDRGEGCEVFPDQIFDSKSDALKALAESEAQ